MSVDLQCFFSECILVMRGSRGGPTLTMFFFIIIILFFFFRGGRILIPLLAGHRSPNIECWLCSFVI